ncbi:sugar phosphate isomerase/epimerase [Plantactinospora sp. KLBMP9567]|uniref:sugar phosphate isomerase/epimerase family protein n=1 Tax=Plantactinospora sp. KLBMP9567 TaxID=3085900 RepID=UPI00298186F5|nr:sugar phosphate isomerase/epimerase [Plantactinospora sp. KLBMP9567]MDW5327979.1 sugar phosphate isomerase/epimerase [Plantactinospora sp. KLBMP9567]
MRLGLLTACLPGEPLDAIAGWAAGHGYRGLEVAAWPREPDRPWQASHLDVDRFDAAEADRVRALLDGHGLSVSAVAYYENNLHADPATRERIHRHLRRCVDAAALLGCEHVGTFVGRDVTRTVTENLRLGEEVLPPLVAYAADRGVRLVVENCPMEGWHPDGYPANLAYSPELWDWLGGLGLFLNFDPSHLVWLGIDPIAALTGHLDLVRHVQAKDVQVDAAARNRFGVFGQLVGKPSPWTSGWWRYRVPGLGEVDWRRLVDVLYEGGYRGFVSVEHEDPVWSGSPERVRQGLVIAERTLGPLLVA